MNNYSKNIHEFGQEFPIVEESSRTTASDIKIRKRNMRPCYSCSTSQKKVRPGGITIIGSSGLIYCWSLQCDISPPFSAKLCKDCSRKGRTSCPPFVSRKKRFRLIAGQGETQLEVRHTEPVRCFRLFRLIQCNVLNMLNRLRVWAPHSLQITLTNYADSYSKLGAVFSKLYQQSSCLRGVSTGRSVVGAFRRL